MTHWHPDTSAPSVDARVASKEASLALNVLIWAFLIEISCSYAHNFDS